MTSTKRNIINGILVLAIIGLIIIGRFFKFINLNLTMTFVYGILSIQQLVWAYYYHKNNQKEKAIQGIICSILCIIMDIYIFIKF